MAICVQEPAENGILAGIDSGLATYSPHPLFNDTTVVRTG
jgi:hypothetical protein